MLPRKRNQSTILSKTVLAELMAKENVTVIHDETADTASFDLKSRVVTLPILKDMRGYMYDAFIAHEIAHALYTPLNKFENAIVKEKIPHAIINIIEDARIEKLVQRTYPGTKRDFTLFYRDVSSPERDFFGLTKLPVNPKTGVQLTLDDLSVLDRINLHFKIGPTLITPIKFSQEEQVFVDRTAKAETFDDVLDVCRDLLKYLEDTNQIQYINTGQLVYVLDKDGSSKGKKVQKKSKKSSEQQKKKSDEGDKDGGKSEEGDNSEDSGDGQESEDGNGEDSSDGAGEDDSSTGEEENGSEGNEDGGDYISISITQDSFDHCKATQLQEPQKTGGKTQFGILPYSDQNSIKDIKGINQTYSNKVNSDNTTLANFMTTITPTVNNMVNRFNMKKSAREFQKTVVSKTGSLDVSNLSKYRTKSDIFKRNEEIPESKNHGMIMFIDWSGSMGNLIESTVKQLLVLTEFCMKVNIPFEVYGFTDGAGGKSSIFSVPKGKFYSTGVGKDLFSLLSSKNKREYKRHAEILLSYVCNNQASYITSMAGTPLCHVSIVADSVVKDFKSKHPQIEKINLIVLTDGEPTDSFQVEGQQQFSNTKFIFQAEDSRKNYIVNYPKNYQTMFSYVKDNNNLNSVIGIFVTDSYNTTLPEYLTGDKEKGLPKNVLADAENSFKNTKCATINRTKDMQEGFDQWYIVDINNFAQYKAKASDVSRAKNNMIFMNILIDKIS